MVRSVYTLRISETSAQDNILVSETTTHDTYEQKLSRLEARALSKARVQSICLDEEEPTRYHSWQKSAQELRRNLQARKRKQVIQQPDPVTEPTQRRVALALDEYDTKVVRRSMRYSPDIIVLG